MDNEKREASSRDLDMITGQLLCIFACGSATYAAGMIVLSLYLGQ